MFQIRTLFMPGNSENKHWTDYATILVLMFTLVVIVWYTVETKRLRTITQEQLSRSVLPLVVLDFRESSSNNNLVFPIIKNVGFGPAFNINVSNLENGNCKLNFYPISGLGKDSELILPLYTYCETKNGISGTWDDAQGFTKWVTKLSPDKIRGDTNRFSIEVKFQDSRGTNYQIEQEIQCNASEEPEIREIRAVVTKFPNVQ